MPAETVTVFEFHLSRELPRAAGFALGISGAALLFFSVAFHGEGAPIFLGVAGFLLLLLSMVCFTFRKVVRLDKRTGKAEQTLGTFLWKKTRSYSLRDFHEVGVGMGGHHYYKTSTQYFVQLIGSANLGIPGSSTNKAAIFSLAEQIGDYLELPVDKQPKAVFFRMRL